MTSFAERMMRLFGGYQGAHGTHGTTDRNLAKGGKLEIKKTARTVREPVTVELWEQHLSGSRALGIIPIREDQMCVWGCIDVDRYDINLGETVREVRKRRLPLVICRTKSGGAHAFLFLSEAAPAAELRAVLKQMAASMGWGDCEIFPKQSQILAERGDLGNWLNMPYLGGNKTDRYAVKETLAAYDLAEFLALADEAATTLDITIPDTADEDDESLSDGPPCLQHLSKVGFPDGTRNKGLFALGVFCKKKFGSRWKDMVEQYNRDFMKPPLPSDEVTDLIQNLERKDYQYTCKDEPLCSYCNSSLCRIRKFGVGGSGSYPIISGLSKLETDPPIWFLDIEEERIELETRALQNYREFQSVCMDQLTVMYMPMRADTWAEMVGTAMQNAIILEASPEMSVRGHFEELLEAFLTDRHRGDEREDILLGKPWQDPENLRHWLRLKDLMDYLDREGFRTWGRNKVGQILEQMGGRRGINIKGKFVNLFWVEGDWNVPAPADLPPIKESPI